MKEYERYVFWVQYFNSELRRSEGRRVPVNMATRDPRVDELEEACRRLNLQPSPQVARYPGRSGVESGYVSVKKSKPKRNLMDKIAKELIVVRAARQRKERSGGRKK